MMKLSDDMLSMMKNFSSINSSIVLRKGNVQRSMSSNKTVLVEAEFADDIPVDFGIYDLNQFLGNVMTLNNPDLTFKADCVVMNDGKMKLEYHACSPTLIISPPDKDLVMKSVDVKFDITTDTLNKMLKLATMNNLPNLSIIGKNGKLVAMAHDKKADTSNTVMTDLCPYDGKDFDASFSVDNIKVISDDYTVEIMGSGFSKFTSKTRKLKYFVALESK
jgi:hypothetical protein